MYHTMMPRLAILEIVRGFHNRQLLNSQDIQFDWVNSYKDFRHKFGC
jgi:hypothetical protein